MDRLPSTQHPDNCDCPQCVVFGTPAVRMNERFGLPPLVRDEPCHGFANGCRCEAKCAPRLPANKRPRPTVVPLRPGRPRFAAARLKRAA